MNIWDWLPIIVVVITIVAYSDGVRRRRNLKRVAREMFIAHSRLITDRYQEMRRQVVESTFVNVVDMLNNYIIDEAKLRDEMMRKM